MQSVSSEKPIVAITGGTGFVGQHLIKAAASAGYTVRALTRRPRDPHPQIEWILGDITSEQDVESLLLGASTVIHLAGLTKALHPKEFFDVNAAATGNLAKIAAANGCKIIHISSLAAREPHLSDYAESKSLADQYVAASGAFWTILRPPAVYGPLDTEMLPIWKMAQKGYLLCPAHGNHRLSLIYVEDLVSAILSLIDAKDVQGQIYELDDGTDQGYSYQTLADHLSAYYRKPVKLIPLPIFIVRLLGIISSLRMKVTNKPQVLSPKKVNELLHPDWTAKKNKLNEEHNWKPKIKLLEGLKRTIQQRD